MTRFWWRRSRGLSRNESCRDFRANETDDDVGNLRLLPVAKGLRIEGR
jgi:hypothetical protein